MKIKYEQPPNIERLREVFPPSTLDNAIFAYGDTIYHPNGFTPPEPALRFHEGVHSEQQGDDPAGWWERYCVDIDFRLAQEYEAHQLEYEYRKMVATDRHARRALLNPMAERLSSSFYGFKITKRQARTALKRGYLHEPIQGNETALRKLRVE